MAEDDAGVARARSNMVRAVADAGEAMVDADWIRASSVVMAMKLSEPVVQVTWPMVNVSPHVTCQSYLVHIVPQIRSL